MLKLQVHTEAITENEVKSAHEMETGYKNRAYEESDEEEVKPEEDSSHAAVREVKTCRNEITLITSVLKIVFTI